MRSRVDTPVLLCPLKFMGVIREEDHRYYTHVPDINPLIITLQIPVSHFRCLDDWSSYEFCLNCDTFLASRISSISIIIKSLCKSKINHSDPESLLIR